MLDGDAGTAEAAFALSQEQRRGLPRWRRRKQEELRVTKKKRIHMQEVLTEKKGKKEDRLGGYSRSRRFQWRTD